MLKIDLSYESVRDNVCKGNAFAALFIIQMLEVLHLWDDLVDKDKPLDPAVVDRCFESMLLTIPANPFYQQNVVSLHAVLRLAITSWQVATEYERNPTESTDLQVAFVLRSTYIDLVTTVAGICGGPGHARDVSRIVHRECHNEGFEAFCNALTVEAAARERNTHEL